MAKSKQNEKREDKSPKLINIPDDPSPEEARELFINRELSWLDFNLRVLENARDKETPLAERLNFLAITQSNQDEFVSVRMGSLRRQRAGGLNTRDFSGYTIREQIEAVGKKLKRLIKKEYSCYQRQIVPALKRYGIRFMDPEELDRQQLAYAEQYYDRELHPILTPMAVDQGRPFPLIMHGTQNIAVLLEHDGENQQIATVQVPSNVPRLIEVPRGAWDEEDLAADDVDREIIDKHGADFIFVEDLIKHFLGRLFYGYEILTAGDYRIIRNADFDLDEEDAPDLMIEIEEQVRLRDWGPVLQLYYETKLDPRLLSFLQTEMEVKEEDLYPVSGPLDLTFLSELRSKAALKVLPELRYHPFSPQPPAMLPQDQDIFTTISEKDILLSHPYESFEPVMDLIAQAAEDPDVLAIKQTLYRVSGKSPIIANLAKAARNGKQVLVLLELKARFDEDNNIHWARALEEAGCHVIYGLVGLKTHSKITLIVRREEQGIKRYIHLGTGNYNDATAKIYTDIGFLTTSEALGEDATNFFNLISGYAEPPTWNKLATAPLNLRETFYGLIDREIQAAESGYTAHIVAKMNSLCDEGIIRKLYRASQAGVKIELIVRGLNSLRAGVPGLSENITVRSLVGRYLEHSRIYAFYNKGRREVYCSSADWMPRNLDRRVELLFPIEDKVAEERLYEILNLQLQDTERSFVMQPDGEYKQLDLRSVRDRLDSMNHQENLAMERAHHTSRSSSAVKFEPRDVHDAMNEYL